MKIYVPLCGMLLSLICLPTYCMEEDVVLVDDDQQEEKNAGLGSGLVEQNYGDNEESSSFDYIEGGLGTGASRKLFLSPVKDEQRGNISETIFFINQGKHVLEEGCVDKKTAQEVSNNLKPKKRKYKQRQAYYKLVCEQLKRELESVPDEIEAIAKKIEKQEVSVEEWEKEQNDLEEQQKSAKKDVERMKANKVGSEHLLSAKESRVSEIDISLGIVKKKFAAGKKELEELKKRTEEKKLILENLKSDFKNNAELLDKAKDTLGKLDELIVLIGLAHETVSREDIQDAYQDYKEIDASLPKEKRKHLPVDFSKLKVMSKFTHTLKSYWDSCVIL